MRLHSFCFKTTTYSAKWGLDDQFIRLSAVLVEKPSAARLLLLLQPLDRVGRVDVGVGASRGEVGAHEPDTRDDGRPEAPVVGELLVLLSLRSQGLLGILVGFLVSIGQLVVREVQG